MHRADNPFGIVDEVAVMGALRDLGTRDPDALRDRKRALLRSLRWLERAGFVLLLLGAALLMVWRLWPVALAAVVLGAWLWLRGRRNMAAVEAGYSQFLKTPSP